MKHLILVRHAEAQREGLVPADRDRALNMVGMQQVERLRPLLQPHLLNLDLVLSSNVRRTRQTLQGIQPLLPATVEISFDDALYPTTAPLLWRRIQQTLAKYHKIMIIAHNPGLGNFANEIDSTLRDFPPAGALICASKNTSWQNTTALDWKPQSFLTV